MTLKDHIRTVPHWPKQGIMFRDITTLLLNPEAFRYCIQQMKKNAEQIKPTTIAGIDSRGFIFASALAHELSLPLLLIRKKGKLPAATISQEYSLEYGTDTVELHSDAVAPSDRILIVDDLIATGGTAEAACRLVEKAGAVVAGLSFVIALPELQGMEKLKKYATSYLVEYEGE